MPPKNVNVFNAVIVNGKCMKNVHGIDHQYRTCLITSLLSRFYIFYSISVKIIEP